jgi:hypothetical protein
MYYDIQAFNLLSKSINALNLQRTLFMHSTLLKQSTLFYGIPKGTTLLLDPCLREYSISMRYIPYGKGPFLIPYNSSIWFLRLMWVALGSCANPKGNYVTTIHSLTNMMA